MRSTRLAIAVLVVALAVSGCSPSPSSFASSPVSPGPGAAGLAEGDRRVRVGPIWLDATEVTVEQMRRFAAAAGLRTAAERDGGGFEFVAGWVRRAGWTFERPHGVDVRSELPAVHVSWAEARDYCAWAGGRLPRAQEWEAAAYHEGRPNPPSPLRPGETYRYPTGTAVESAANIEGADDGHPEAAPVASFPAGVNGLYDMGGNVWEWLADAQGENRLTAGGSWWYGPSQMTADAMQYKPAEFYAVYVGFRCAYDSLPEGVPREGTPS